jgi:DHA2 family multidrug resistance protein-like MFS transporter
VVGVAALTTFVRRQLHLPDPLIDIRLFCNRVLSGVVTANLLSVLGLSGAVFFLSQYFQLVHGYSPAHAGLAELPAALASMVFGVLAGVAVRFWSRRAVLATGLALIGFAMASLATVSPSTGYPRLGVALFIIGAGLGLAYAVANDLILDSVPPERSGAAAAISETAYELGMALGIAVLGSIVSAVYRGFTVPPGIHEDAASYAKETLGAAHVVAGTLPPDSADALLAAGRTAFTHGFAIAAGVGSLLLLASSAAVWLLLRQSTRIHPVGSLRSEHPSHERESQR